MVFQNIQTKRKGLRCSIRVMNHSGDDVLTTYDPEIDNSVQIATEDLQDFWDQCIQEFADYGTTLTPIVAGKRIGNTDYELLSPGEIKSPRFTVGIFEDIVIQPVPLSGG